MQAEQDAKLETWKREEPFNGETDFPSDRKLQSDAVRS